MGVFWLTEVPKPEYKVYKPWKSAFVQSRGLSLLLRAWQITGDEKYLDASKKALVPFTFDILQNGVTAHLLDGKPFYEEYVAAAPTMVLDGHIFSLLGLHDFVRAVPQEKDAKNHKLATQLFEDGVQSLIEWLPKYDLGFWILFNKCELSHYPQNDPCSVGYLGLVVNQLNLLHKITRREEFIKYHHKFKNYKKWTNILRSYYLKFKVLRKINRL